MGAAATKVTRLPAFMDPKPIGRIPPNRGFERPVDFKHNRLGRSRLAVLAHGDFGSRFDAPAGKPHPVTDAGMEGAIITQRKHRGRGRGRTVLAQERQPQARIACVLVRKKAQHNTGLLHESTQSLSFKTAFEEPTPRTL